VRIKVVGREQNYVPPVKRELRTVFKLQVSPFVTACLRKVQDNGQKSGVKPLGSSIHVEVIVLPWIVSKKFIAFVMARIAILSPPANPLFHQPAKQLE
jgi:hypothetical protein